MNEKGGLYAYDLSRYKNVGTLTGGPVWAFDGVLFDGSNDYIDCGDSDAFSFGDGPFTVCSKIYLLGSASTNSIVGKYLDNSPFDGEWYLITTDDDFLYIQVLDDGSNNRLKCVGTQTLSLNRWLSIAATYAGGTDEGSLDVYLDGIKDPSPQRTAYGTYTAMGNYSCPVEIGSSLRNSAYSSYMNGYISYVYIYNRALSEKEITDIHINPYAMFEDPYPIELFGYQAAGGTNYPRTVTGALPAQNGGLHRKLQAERTIEGAI